MASPYKREYFASAPRHALIFHFEAGDKTGAYSGLLKFSDAHNASTIAEGQQADLHRKTGERSDLRNPDHGPQHRRRRQLRKQLRFGWTRLRITKADSLTIVVVAGTNYAPDRRNKWRGDDPHPRISKDLDDILEFASYDKVRKEHTGRLQNSLLSRVAEPRHDRR